ncbi:hypothetical protein IU468_27915 [Nocardia farcinica]|uniref:hypothetical protein n=1 Tax=Nocardia farcinica TaxID=37329 RepID=UPI0018959BD0|nr:hypothetical protein [Nocardia farcinica]MBF6260098.1 hypothetical protein [Nocardia farcinica]
MRNNATVRTYSRELLQLRPARRLVFLESAAGLLLGVATLPQSYPSVGESPMWAQLLGLSFLMTALGANLYMWQRIVSTGVGSRWCYHTPTLSAEKRLRRFILDERRLRMAAIAYAAAICVLVPLPPAWRWFWFVLTFSATALTAVSLRRMWRDEVRGPSGENRRYSA